MAGRSDGWLADGGVFWFMKISNIKIGNRIRKDKGDIQELANSIKDVGLLQPAVVDTDNNLIAGWRRILAHKLLGRGEIEVRIAGNIKDVYQALRAERDENVCQKPFLPSEAVEAAKRIEELEREEAKKRLAVRSEKFSEVKKKDKGNALDKTAKAVGMSRPTYIKAKKVVMAAEKDPISFEYIKDEMDETGKVDRAHKELRRVEKKKAREANKVDLPQDDNIWLGDFREVGQRIPDNSVDIIFTDPPYDENSIGLYRDLGIFAKRVLKPGGLCLAYSGQIHLLKVGNALSENLEFVWTYAIKHQSGRRRIFKVKARNGWKPIFAFCKPPLEVWWEWLDDWIEGKQEKGNHEWQQAIVEAYHFLNNLCISDGLVIDPFCGSGTTLVAAKKLGLRYIGIDSNPDNMEKITRRLNDS